MLATIILDTFTKDEVNEIATALDTLCSPEDHYAFSSAAVYSFWSVPEREFLYIGLAKNVTQRFQQHTGLIACDPLSCKSKELEDYFSRWKRIGYSVCVQSSMCSPLNAEDEETLLEAIEEDIYNVNLRDIFEAGENITLAEGMLIGDCLPKWNKVRGAQRGRKQHSFYPNSNNIKLIAGLLEGKTFEQVEEEIADKSPRNELRLNMRGSKLSELNARATLREIADNSTFCAYELLLHAVRMMMVSNDSSFEKALQFQLSQNHVDQHLVEQMKVDGYCNRVVSLLE